MGKHKTQGVRYWHKKLWPVFSKYIRMRDALETTGTLTEADCITCYSRLPLSKLHAGHWISRTKFSVRYDELNVHAQCASCNTYHNGEPQFYEDRIVELYGEEERDRLKRQMNKTHKYTPMELEEMYHLYKQKIQKLEAFYANKTLVHS